jgi:hypothetical protein
MQGQLALSLGVFQLLLDKTINLLIAKSCTESGIADKKDCRVNSSERHYKQWMDQPPSPYPKKKTSE